MEMQLDKIPKGFKVIAHTENSFSASIANQEKKFYGIQFHPEVIHRKRNRYFEKLFSKDQYGKSRLEYRKIYRHNHKGYSKTG